MEQHNKTGHKQGARWLFKSEVSGGGEVGKGDEAVTVRVGEAGGARQNLAPQWVQKQRHA